MKWVTTEQEATTWLTNDEVPGIQLAIRLEDDDSWSLSWGITVSVQSEGGVVTAATLPMVESWIQAIAEAIKERLDASDCEFIPNE